MTSSDGDRKIDLESCAKEWIKALSFMCIHFDKQPESNFLLFSAASYKQAACPYETDEMFCNVEGLEYIFFFSFLRDCVCEIQKLQHSSY